MKSFKPESDQERLFFTTVRIIVKKKNGKTKSGTGFFYEYKIETGNYADKYSMFLITNRHVIEDSNYVILEFKEKLDKGVTLLGNTFKIRINEPWQIHPNNKIDLAILPFTKILIYLEDVKKQPFFEPILNKITYFKEKNDLINILEEIFFIGYPRGIYDRENNIPIIRKGTTATPIIFDYNDLPIFLIDASVYPGSSGSPVFICDSGSYYLKGKLYLDSRTLFLGVLSSTYKNKDGVYIVKYDFKEKVVNNEKPYLDLGIVIKAQEIINLIRIYLKDQGIL